jgi:hypothetical protein
MSVERLAARLRAEAEHELARSNLVVLVCLWLVLIERRLEVRRETHELHHPPSLKSPRASLERLFREQEETEEVK